jgi:hypothetical protein
MISWRAAAPVLVLALAVTACGDSAGSASPEVVATAAGSEFPTEVAAQILAPETELPAEPDIVGALANLWIDYVLLARLAVEDSTLSNLDVSNLVRMQVEQEMVMRLREQVIQVDTALTAEELRARYEAELPGGRIRARHILVQFPQGATPEQEDSVRTFIGSLRTRILAGEDFAALAREFSQDPGSGANGGDLGSFGSGDMVPPFEEAAFALEVGELSEVVETTFGLHLIRVDERIIPPFEDTAPLFRTQIQNQMLAAAESTYVANLVEASGLTVDESGYESVKRLASDPQMILTGRAADRSLAEFDGGSLTLGEFQQWIQSANVQVRDQIQMAPDEQLEVLLQNLARSEILVAQAGVDGIDVPAERQDSMAAGVRSSVAAIADQMGFFQLTPEEGETMEDAVERAVQEIITGVVNRTREAYPLGAVGFAMRRQFPAEVSLLGLAAAAERVAELRSQGQSAPPLTVTPPIQVPDTTSPDSSGPQG